MTSEPGYQRRTSQSVSLSKFTNKPSQEGKLYAGRRWTLFNRPDGGYSLFEILALASNVMIVSAILAVLMLNWIRSIRRRRATRERELKSSMKQLTSPVDSSSPASNSRPTTGTSRQFDVISDKTTSKISMISSGISLPNSTLVSESLSSTIAKPLPIRGLKQADKLASNEVTSAQIKQQSKDDKSAPKSQLTGTSTAEVLVKQTQTPSETSKNLPIASNKAMAIVQPTENLKDSDSQSTDGNKLIDKKNPSKELSPSSIARSYSDLAASDRKGAKVEPANGGRDSAASESMEVSKRVAALEQLFGDYPESSKKKQKEVEDATEKKVMVAASTGGSRNNQMQSSCSLESIELPSNLIENLAKVEAKDRMSAADAPSPNLLLGQMNKQASEVVDKPEDEPKLAGEVKAVDASELAAQMDESGVQSHNRPKNPAPSNKELPSSQQASVGKQSALAEVRQHQVVVVNKLDKRRTNLEIVDIRDDSVTGKMRAGQSGGSESVAGTNWISMDGVAVVQQSVGQVSSLPAGQSGLGAAALRQSFGGASGQVPPLSPSEIIETRFNVDYSSSWAAQRGRRLNSAGEPIGQMALRESQDEEILNNIESELEQDNRSRNRKYFVYIVHDGHFTAKKECIARIELPQKRRITLAEMRQLIASSQDISVASLRRSKFKFVTETYRLLNEDEDVAVLHQVYPTQGVFLKLNVPEQESQAYALKGVRLRRSLVGPASTPAGSNVSQATIASRRRARRPPDRQDSDVVTRAKRDGQTELQAIAASLSRAEPAKLAGYGRSKSNVQPRRQAHPGLANKSQGKRQESTLPLGLSAAGELGANVISGAKRLLSSTFLGGS